MSFFILFFPLSGRKGFRKEREKCQELNQEPLYQELKKKSPKATIGFPPPNILLPCLKESVLFLLAYFTSKEFFIPSRSWSLTYLSPMTVYKKVKDISILLKIVSYKEANKVIYIVSQFNIFDICSEINFTSYICFFRLIHMLPTSIPQLLSQTVW